MDLPCCGVWCRRRIGLGFQGNCARRAHVKPYFREIFVWDLCVCMVFMYYFADCVAVANSSVSDSGSRCGGTL